MGNMKNTFVMVIILLVSIDLAPMLAGAEPTMSDMAERSNKMMAIEKDLRDLVEYTQGIDRDAANGLQQIASISSTRILNISAFLRIMTMIENQDDRNRVNSFIIGAIKFEVKGIDIDIKGVNLMLSYARNNAIILTGNQLKTELRKLQELLSPENN